MATTFSPLAGASPFRRIAASMWSRPSDPTIYGFLDVDVTTTLEHIQAFRQETGKHITMTHVVARAVAAAFEEHPELNAKVRFWGRLEQRSTVDLTISVSTQDGKDLSAARIDDAGKMSLLEIVEEVGSNVAQTRAGEDETYERSRNTLAALPWWLVRPVLWLTDIVSNEFQLHFPALGMPRDPFGTAIITNVGMFGIDTAFAPFVPLGRCPMLLLVTAVQQRPWVVGTGEDARLEVRPVLRLCASFDHRVVDGAQAGRLATTMRRLVENPAGNLG